MTEHKPVVPPPPRESTDLSRSSHTELGKAIRESTIVNQISARPEPITLIPGVTPSPSPGTPASPAASGDE